jgi:hypothetical protein
VVASRKRENLVESLQVRRNRDFVEITQPIEKIERFCESVRREIHVLWMVRDVIEHRRPPNLLENLEALLKSRPEQAASDLDE